MNCSRHALTLPLLAILVVTVACGSTTQLPTPAAGSPQPAEELEGQPTSPPRPSSTPRPTSTPRTSPTPPDAEKPATATSHVTTTDAAGVRIGMLADDVLELRGQANRTEVVGEDQFGLLVEWLYADSIYTMARREAGGITAYRVIDIRGP